MAKGKQFKTTLKGTLIFILIFLLVPYRAGALGLGNIELDSYLNQPLDAKIDVLSAQLGELDEAQISLASRDAFARAGIQRNAVLGLLEFEFVEGRDGPPQIKVTSEQPIKEPFLDFILEVTWPKGRLLREYTVLLDPPVSTPEPAPPVQAATVTAPEPQQADASQTSPSVREQPAAQALAAASAARSAAPQERLSDDRYGPTSRNDTLWSIAKEVRPDNSVSVQQMMLALVKNNPDAFYNNNVNMLKAGYILRLPDKDLINQLDQAEAVREVKRQHQQWRQAKQGGIPSQPAGESVPQDTQSPVQDQGTAAQTSSAAGDTSAAAKGQEARLKLLPPDEEGSAQGAVTGDEQGQAALQQKLSQAVEANEARQQENQELRAHVNELDEQVESLQRLLALKDETLAALQDRLSQLEGNEVAELGGMESGDQAAQLQSQQDGQAAQPAPPEQSGQAEAQAPAAPPATTSQPQADESASPSQVEELYRSLMADPKMLAMGGGGVLLLGALAWLAVRRRRMNAESYVTAEEGAAAGASDAGGDTLQTAVAGGEVASGGGDLLEAEVNEIDPVAEADVYMAYRRYQQAEELLKSAIQQEPHRHELRLKLVEVYAASGDNQAFMSEAENLQAELGDQDSPVWQKVVAMGRDINPEHPLFAADEGDVQARQESVDNAAVNEADSAGDNTDIDDLLNITSDDELLDLGVDEPQFNIGEESSAGHKTSETEDAALNTNDDDLMNFSLDDAQSGADTGLPRDSSEGQQDGGLEFQPADTEEQHNAGDSLDFSAEPGGGPQDDEVGGLELSDGQSLEMEQPRSEDQGDDELKLQHGDSDEQAGDEAEGLAFDQPAAAPQQDDAQAPGLSDEQSPQDTQENALDFEPGLGKGLDGGAAESTDEPKGQADAGVGNEIDFDLNMADTGSTSGGDQHPPAGGAALESEESESGGLDDLAYDEPQGGAGLEDLSASGDETRPDGSLSDTTGELDEMLSGGEALAQGGEATGDSDQDNELPFSFDFDNMASQNSDDNLFEGFEDLDSDSGDEEEDDSAEVGTKLDLAKAFIEMGDQDGAKDILKEVIDVGDEDQKKEAQGLLEQLEA